MSEAETSRFRPPSREEIDRVLSEAREDVSKYKDMYEGISYEIGLTAGIKWVLGFTDEHPYSDQCRDCGSAAPYTCSKCKEAICSDCATVDFRSKAVNCTGYCSKDYDDDKKKVTVEDLDVAACKAEECLLPAGHEGLHKFKEFSMSDYVKELANKPRSKFYSVVTRTCVGDDFVPYREIYLLGPQFCGGEKHVIAKVFIEPLQDLLGLGDITEDELPKPLRDFLSWASKSNNA